MFLGLQWYRSADGFRWELVRVLDRCRNQYGRMWECPDFFALDGKQIIFTSPQDIVPVGLEFHAGNGTLCLMGSYDPETGFTRERIQAIDYGLDFYTPQEADSITFEADGQVLIDVEKYDLIFDGGEG